MSGIDPTLITIDNTEAFNEIIKSFKKDAVLVGIPAEDDEREKEKNEIGNAAILAINVFGSPARNIPPRDVMSVGLRNSQARIADQFKLAAQNAFKQGKSALETHYERAGIVASGAIKKAINDQDGIQGPSETTLAIRRSGGFQKWVAGGATFQSLYHKNSAVKLAGGFVGTKALIVTGQMRNAITYVVQSVWGRG